MKYNVAELLHRPKAGTYVSAFLIKIYFLTKTIDFLLNMK